MAKLFNDYRAWCEDNNEKPMTRQDFYAAISSMANGVQTIEVATMGRTKMLLHVAFKEQVQAA
jgi:phage/plasmid-associated DNA primase